MSVDAIWVSGNFPELTNVTLIGEGGQKRVFRAQHPTDGTVVLKAIDRSQNPESVQREILAVASINSPRVPRIFAQGVTAGQVWVREQCIEGSSLRDLIASGVRLDVDSLIKLGKQILEAVQGAEQAQIVHRDIKPDNIMCATNGDYWLLDFGIARHLQLNSLTATGNPFGKLTLGYAPVEQMRNNKPAIDSRSDLFALGITLVEASCGDHPFWIPSPPSQMEVVRRVESLDVAVDFGTSPKATELAAFVSTLIQKRRDLRPRDASEALAWLNAIEQMA